MECLLRMALSNFKDQRSFTLSMSAPCEAQKEFKFLMTCVEKTCSHIFVEILQLQAPNDFGVVC